MFIVEKIKDYHARMAVEYTEMVEKIGEKLAEDRKHLYFVLDQHGKPVKNGYVAHKGHAKFYGRTKKYALEQAQSFTYKGL